VTGINTLRVAAILLTRNGCIFVAKRSAHSSLPGFWEFPGGKIEPEETPQDCIVREIHEEFGMSVALGEHFITVYQDTDLFRLELVCYFGTSEEQKPAHLNDHDEYQWIKIQQLRNLDLAPADVEVADQLIAKWKPL